MDLLHAQFNNGHLHESEIMQLLGESDFAAHWPVVRKKFAQDENGLWFNKRLEDEQIKRQRFTESRRRNLKTKEEKPHMNTHMAAHMETHMEPHMENENENDNLIVIDNRTVTNKGPKNRIDELFEHIWNAYGKKGTKQTALAKFRKLSKDDMKAIMGHVEQYVQNHKDNGKLEFLPHFTTYINQRRWMDELPYTKKQGWDDIDWNAPQKGWFE